MRKLMQLIILTILIAIVLSALAGCGGDNGGSLTKINMSILIPAYFSPSSGDYWSRLITAASQNPGLIYAIVNAHNGPGTLLSTNYETAINSFRANGGKCIGYVYTEFGSRDMATVKSEIDQWYVFYNIDGIFLDEQSRAIGMEVYYQELYSYIKNNHPNALIVGNPGTNTRETYITLNGKRSSDVFCIFENYYSDFGNWTPEEWCGNYDRTNFAVLIKNTGSSSWRSALERAYSLGAGWIDITDDSGENNWDTLPSYFSDLCKYISDRS